MVRSILNTLFPLQCLLCLQEEEALCSSCAKNLRRAVNTPDESITAVYSFKDSSVKKIIHKGKYYHNRPILESLTKHAVTSLREENFPFEKMTICIPIPMPTTRRLMRGYNQSACIASTIATVCSIQTHCDILVRSRAPRRQVTQLSKLARSKNQKGSFSISADKKDMLRDAVVLLVDDVTTTGATLLEARKELLLGGAQEVYSLALAH